MNKYLYLTVLFFSFSIISCAQSFDDSFSRKNMMKDLQVFKEVRLQANSGLYKYRTKAQIDSLYSWAESEMDKSNTYLDFYNIISQLTDFEGSCHNGINLNKKYWENLRKETSGYFPYPIKWINGVWRLNYDQADIPLGSEIVSINQEPISSVIKNLSKYITTDGINQTGKRIGIRGAFGKYYRLHYGMMDHFELAYSAPDSGEVTTKTIESVSFSLYGKNINRRYSRKYDQSAYVEWKENEKYTYHKVDNTTGLLTIRTFSMGNESTETHKRYCTFLDSVFISLKNEGIENLIVDVRENGGGSDPNDLVTYSYLTQRNFQENKQAWIKSNKVPLLGYYDTWVPRFIRFAFVGIYNKRLRKEFPDKKNGGYYQDASSSDHLVRTPNKNAFTGNIYLLIDPGVASAASLFAAMVAGNDNTTTIGEETLGGYYGHNGHTPFTYELPKSKIKTYFSIVNLEQDVPEKSNQFYNRGIMPDHDVSQTYEDFLSHTDTPMNYTLDLIKQRN